MSSVAGRIADAAAAAVQALALTYAGKPVAVARRKTLTLPQGADPPQVVVCVKEEGEWESLTARKVLVRYPLGFLVVTAGGGLLQDDEAIRLILEELSRTIDDKERATFAGVPEFNRATAGGKVPFDPAALGKTLNYALRVYTVEAIQTRAG